jgi:hypothetical protein
MLRPSVFTTDEPAIVMSPAVMDTVGATTTADADMFSLDITLIVRLVPAVTVVSDIFSQDDVFRITEVPAVTVLPPIFRDADDVFSITEVPAITVLPPIFRDAEFTIRDNSADSLLASLMFRLCSTGIVTSTVASVLASLIRSVCSAGIVKSAVATPSQALPSITRWFILLVRPAPRWSKLVQPSLVTPLLSTVSTPWPGPTRLLLSGPGAEAQLQFARHSNTVPAAPPRLVTPEEELPPYAVTDMFTGRESSSW